MYRKQLKQLNQIDSTLRNVMLPFQTYQTPYFSAIPLNTPDVCRMIRNTHGKRFLHVTI